MSFETQPGSGHFTLFSELPTEIRVAIWRLSLPSRVLEVDYIRMHEMFELDEQPCKMNRHLTNLNSRTPVLARVSQEARAAALAHWIGMPTAGLGHEARFSWNYLCWPEPYFDAWLVQNVHLNWTLAGNAEFACFGDPIRYLKWIASHTRMKAVSITLDLLTEAQYNADSSSSPWTLSELVIEMRQQLVWTVVVLEPVFIHAAAQIAAHSGLFGLLRDAPVQIIHASDVELLDRIKLFNGRDDVCFSSSTWYEDMLGAQHDLTSVVEALFVDNPSGRPTPTFLAAVMFRLCVEGCVRCHARTAHCQKMRAVSQEPANHIPS
jgi:hypothetical protein